MKILKTIYADKGKILTNGEIYGRQIYLAEGMSEEGFYEITEEDHEEIIRNQTETEA